MLKWKLVLCALSLTVIGCGDDEQSCGITFNGTNIPLSPPAREIDVDITGDTCVPFMGTTTLTCSYEIVHTPDPTKVNYAAEGHFNFPSTHFAVVSGDSSWVDTVRVNERRVHKVTLQAKVKGDWLLDAFVRSVLDSTRTIGGARSIEIHVN